MGDKNLHRWLGGYSISETHDPIPNSNVKPYSADGTMLFKHGRVSCCQACNANL